MKQSSNRRLTLAVLAAVGLGLIGFAPGAKADWNPGDPYKMHFPQLPDPNGWDVQFTTLTLADDWRCTQTGPVSDVHLWNWYYSDLHAVITNIHISIHDDVPQDAINPYSHPGSLLWQGDFKPGQFTERLYDPGDPLNPTQGYYIPGTGGGAWPYNHSETWQINITNIQAPFIQHVGSNYWLDVRADISFAGAGYWAGWKTSTNHFLDDAVWWDAQTGTWQELIDPQTGQSLDMAFVITGIPEPATVALVGAGAAALVIWRRRK